MPVSGKSVVTKGGPAVGKVSSKPDIIRLSDLGKNTRIVAEKDGDRVVRGPEEVAHAVLATDFTLEEARAGRELANRRNLLRQQVELLQDKLFGWYNDRSAVVKEAYFVMSKDCQMFLVVQKEPEFNPELEQALSDLMIEVANDPAFSMTKLDVQAMPPCDEADIRSFIPVPE